jgi:LmbE family N-acetylglucosaminyl deacetylase
MNVLVLAAHPDDETIGCGGTISKHIRNGDKVSLILFSEGHKPIQPNLKEYNKNATEILGIEWSDIYWLGLPSGTFDTQNKLEVNMRVTTILNKVKPDYVYTHYYEDIHQDHRFVYDSTMVACRPQIARGVDEEWHGVKKILCYEVPSSTNLYISQFSANHYEILDKIDIDNKLNAFVCYKGEVRKGFNARSLDSLKTWMKYRGSQISHEFAESFQLQRSIR